MARAACTACHSSADTAASRLPIRTTRTPGKSAAFSLPGATSVEPSVAGWITRACSMPGSFTSPTHTASPETLGRMIGFVTGLPTTV